MANTLQTTFSYDSSCTEVHAFHPIFTEPCPKDLFIDKPAMVWIVAWCREGDRP